MGKVRYGDAMPTIVITPKTRQYLTYSCHLFSQYYFYLRGCANDDDNIMARIEREGSEEKDGVRISRYRPIKTKSSKQTICHNLDLTRNVP